MNDSCDEPVLMSEQGQLAGSFPVLLKTGRGLSPGEHGRKVGPGMLLVPWDTEGVAGDIHKAVYLPVPLLHIHSYTYIQFLSVLENSEQPLVAYEILS